jgi:hypothetical protein
MLPYLLEVTGYMFRLANKSHHQASYIHLKCYILPCVHIMGSHIVIVIVMYVPLCGIVLFCVLFVCACVLDNCHRDIGALFDYPT